MDRFALLGRFARSAIGAIVFHLVGLGMVAGAVGALAAELPDGDRELRAYEASSRCPSAPREPADCLWTRPFTVDEVDPSPRARPTPGQRATFTLAFWLLMTALCSPIPATLLPYGSEAEHAVLTAVIWLPIATGMIITARIYTVRKRARTSA